MNERLQRMRDRIADLKNRPKHEPVKPPKRPKPPRHVPDVDDGDGDGDGTGIIIRVDPECLRNPICSKKH